MNNNAGWLRGLAFLVFLLALNNPSLWGLFIILLIAASIANSNNTQRYSSRSRRVTVRRDADYRYKRSAPPARRPLSADERAAAMRARRTGDTLQAYPHAVKAAHAAGLYPSTNTLYPSDIGVLV